jgi:glycosyltransferase 2 family protein
MMYAKKTFSRLLPIAIVAAVGWFFYRTLSENWDKLDGVDLSLGTSSFIGAILFTAAVVVSGYLWGKMLEVLSGNSIKVSDAIRIHAASWLLKYVPGQIGSYLNKLAWGTKNGFSKKTVSTSFIYENVLMVIAGLTLSVPAFLIFRQSFESNIFLFLPALMIIPMVVVLSRQHFYKLLNTIFRLLNKKPFRESDFLAGHSLFRFFVGYFVPRLLNGIGFVLIVQSILPVNPSMYIGLGATYILGSIVGLLAFFVPGGLGVREAVIVAFLSVYFPVEQAIIVALITRVYATISDVGVAFVYIVLNRGKIIQQ